MIERGARDEGAAGREWRKKNGPASLLGSFMFS
jgi:hypothetical protein